MKITTLICENCGKQFMMEYFDGGYIDHMNMVNNFPTILMRGIDDIIEAICMNGNDYRGSFDIETRQKCFIKWLQNQKIEKDTIDKVIEGVNKQKKHIYELDLIRKKIQNDLKEVSSIDRNYIIKHLSS